MRVRKEKNKIFTPCEQLDYWHITSHHITTDNFLKLTWREISWKKLLCLPAFQGTCSSICCPRGARRKPGWARSRRACWGSWGSPPSGRGSGSRANSGQANHQIKDKNEREKWLSHWEVWCNMIDQVERFLDPGDFFFFFSSIHCCPKGGATCCRHSLAIP